MADEITESQVATAETGQAAATGTPDTASGTDVAAAGADAQQGATPPESGTTDTSVGAETAEAAPETPEAAKSRRERQREARKAASPPAPAPAPTPEQIIAEYRRQENERQQAEAAHRTRVEGNAKFIGENPVTVNGEQITEYERVRREANQPLEVGLTIDELEAHNKAVHRFNELTERRQMLANEVDPIRQTATQQARGEALQWMGNQFEQGIADVGVDVQAVLSAGATVAPDAKMPTIIKALATHLTAPLSEKIADLEDQHEADQSEIDALRRQLGGNAPQGMRGGMAAAGGNGALTMARYNAMTPAERRKLSSTERDEMMARHVAEQRNGRRAG